MNKLNFFFLWLSIFLSTQIGNTLGACPYLDIVVNATPTHSTVADGNWNSVATWQGGNIPSGNLNGQIVNINHEVTRSGDLNLGNGMLNVLGILDLPNENLTMNNNSGILNIDHGLILLLNGNIEAFNGAVNLNHGAIHICNDNYIDQSSGGTNGEGYIFVAGGNIEDFQLGNFSASIAWCSPNGNGTGLPTSENCAIASPPGGCGDTDYYKTLCPITAVTKTVTGKVFQDSNEDGIDNDGVNSGIGGVTIYIYDDFNQNGIIDINDILIDMQLTNARGAYNFLVDGDSTTTNVVITTNPNSFANNQYLTTDNLETVVFTNSDLYPNNNFGISNSTYLQNDTWLDLNGNGVQEPIEIGIPNMPVCIANTSPLLINGTLLTPNTYLDTIYSDVNGFYVFDNLPDCDWQIEVHHNPALYTPTYDADGGVLNVVNFKLSNGQVLASDNHWCQSNDCLDELDFGFRLAGEYSLSGTICIDDGSKDGICGTSGEDAFEPVDLLLYDDEGTFFGGVTNNNNGAYTFPFLPTDTYIVSLSTTQMSLDTFFFTTKQAATPAEELLVTSFAILQKVPVLQDVFGVDFAFIPHPVTAIVLANDDTFQICPGINFENWVGANDTTFSEAVHFTIISPTQQGEVSIDNTGTFQYEPTTKECGMDQFTYQLCDVVFEVCDTAVVTLLLADDTAPTLGNIPEDLTIICNEELPDPALISAYDNCPRISLDIEEESTQGEDGCSIYDYELIRTWTATDLCGNVSEATQTITVTDIVPPGIFRIYTLPNGKKMIGGTTVLVGEQWQTISLPVDFETTPIVFTQVTSNNDITPVIAQIRAVSKSQFEMRLATEEGQIHPHQRESLSWIAMEKGSQMADYHLLADVASINNNGQDVTFQNEFPTQPSIFTNLQTTNEPDPVVIYHQNLNTNGVNISLVEEQSEDTETNHILEEVAYLALQNTSTLRDEQGAIIGEVGSSSIEGNRTTIQLNHTYSNPIVLVNGENYASTNPIIFRVNTVNPNSFEVQLQSWSTLNLNPNNVNISYLVLEGSIPLYVPDFCENGRDELIIGTDIKAIDDCDVSVDLTYEEFEAINGTEKIINRTWRSTDECGNETVYSQQITCEGIGIVLKTYLQGALIGSQEEGLMRDDLRQKNLIPTQEPYTLLPNFQHFGKGGGEQTAPELLQVIGPNAIVDWVFLEVRHASEIEKVVATCSALVQRDGDVISASGDSLIIFENVAYGAYNISIRHRNHIGMLTRAPFTFSLTQTPTLDFRNVFTPTTGTRPAIKIGNNNAQWCGDLNGDGKTIYQGPQNDAFEMFLSVILDETNDNFLINYINRGYTQRDFNLDGSVIFQGPNNDRSNLLFNTILAHPDNTKFLANFIVVVQDE